MTPQVEVVPGSLRKVCQLTGEWDRQRGAPAHNRTESRFGLVGTDLGASVEHDGRLWFLFGDTWPEESGGDSVAWTTDRAPEPGIDLTFVGDGGRFVPPRVRGVSSGFFEVPTGGFSAHGHLYVVRTTDHHAEGGRQVMGRSVLTRAVDGDPTDLDPLYDVSVLAAGGRFVNAACVVRGADVWVFGSGRYRASDAYLARVPLARVEDRRAWRFWGGGRAWSADEREARALFAHPQVGELSAAWVAPLRCWLLLYNAGSPRGILARVAADPWGPWSDPVVVLDPAGPLGYGAVMHVAGGPDGLSDPGREHEWGGEYGPYVIDRYTRAAPGGGATVYFTLSTWNPYNVLEMRMELRRCAH